MKENESKSNAPRNHYFCGHCSTFRKADKQGACVDCKKPIWELLNGPGPLQQDAVENERMHSALAAIARGGKTSRGMPKKSGAGKKNPSQATLPLG